MVWAIITWLIYAVVLHTRLLAGWRGKRAAILSIIGFITILIAFFGIKLIKKVFMSSYDILIVGLNHKTADVDIRERLAFNGQKT